jgi:ankyrin repeat protein
MWRRNGPPLGALDESLVTASRAGDAAGVAASLAAGASLTAEDPKGYNALALAVLNDHPTIVASLLDAGSPIESTCVGQTPLYMACCKTKCNPSLVSLLIRKGANINHMDHTKMTPLTWCAHHGHAAAAQLLLDAGADLNATDQYHMTALYWAIYQGNLQLASMLVSAGADIEEPNGSGLTPLIGAVAHRHLHLLPLLLSVGAKIEAREDDGTTALMRAGSARGIGFLTPLLHAGAQVNSINSKGDSALGLAITYGLYPDTICILLAAGANVLSKAALGEDD